MIEFLRHYALVALIAITAIATPFAAVKYLPEPQKVVITVSGNAQIEQTGGIIVVSDITGHPKHVLVRKKVARLRTSPVPTNNIIIDIDTLRVERLRFH